MESSRRQQTQADLGMDFAKEDQKREAALAKEQARADKKAAKREKMMNMPSYRLMVGTAKYMDKYFLDPILGFVLPAGIGDALSSVLAFPFIYYSLCVVKSIPLTLAVIYNILMDVLIGSIPFYIGDVLDVFKRSYVENLKLITGYIEDDKEIINKELDGILGGTFLFAVGRAVIGFFVFVNTMIISYLDRKKEFDIFKNLGMTSKQINTLILGEGLTYGLVISAIIAFCVGTVELLGKLILVGESWNYRSRNIHRL